MPNFFDIINNFKIIVALIRQNEKSPIYREKMKIGGGYVFPKNKSIERRI